MSDCRNGGRFSYAGSARPTTSADPDVMRGKLVFRDGTELALTYNRHGREVDHFEMDGVRYMPRRERDWDAESED